MNWSINLTTDAVVRCKPGTYPWEVKIEGFVPPKGKTKRHEWYVDPQTTHYFYSLIEGTDPNLRVRGDNQACLVYGIVCDYDHQQGPGVDMSRLLNHQFKPNYIDVTFSNNHRALWLFEEPLPVPNNEAYKAFAEFLLKQRIVPFATFMPQLDKPSFLDASHRWCNWLHWQKVHDKPLSADLVRGWWIEASKRIQWKDMGPDIPIEIIEKALQEKYPTFAWPGEFAFETQGPTFWVPQSTSPMSAIVHQGGIYTFSASAGKAWWSWTDLLGADFVNQYRTAQLGAAVEGIYCDSMHYWVKKPDGKWKEEQEGEIRRLLAERGLSDRRIRGELLSRLDAALHYIRQYQRVDGAGPLVFRPEGLVKLEDSLLLNTSSRRAMPPAEELTPWGEAGKFPTISRFFDEPFLVNKDQTTWLLAWMQRYYASALKLDPLQGQAIYLAGEAGTGKSFFCEVILGGMFNGTRDASDYINDADDFGGELFECGILFVDDAKSGIDNLVKRKAAEIVKALVSKHVHSMHKKYQQRTKIWWIGRIVVCMNVDPHSLEQLPGLDISNDDKVSFLRTSGKLAAAINALPETERRSRVMQELPYFCRWLLAQDFSFLPSDVRYGIKYMRDSSLESSAQNNSGPSSFREMMHAWMNKDWSKRSTDHWTGSCWDLCEELSRYCLQVNMRAPTVNDVKKGVAGLEQFWQKSIAVEEMPDGTRQIRIPNPAAKPPPVVPEQKPNSKWEKPQP